LPVVVRHDLIVLSAQVKLLEGGAERALDQLRALPEAARRSDALIDARACLVESEAQLMRLPADRRAAARHAIRALRRAREAGLAEPETLAQQALARARRPKLAESPPERYAPPAVGQNARADPGGSLWAWLDSVAAGAGADAAAHELARQIVGESGAERAFVALVDDHELCAAWAVDLDGLPITQAADRVPRELLASALLYDGPVNRPEVSARGAVGAQLAVAAPAGAALRAVILLEHRFVPRRFDGVHAQHAVRWATAAGLVGRLLATSSVASAVSSADSPRREMGDDSAPALFGLDAAEPSTALPATRRRHFPTVVGASTALERALRRLEAALDSELPVLITGETGVGKELFARALHDYGASAKKPFVALDCGAVPDTLIEAELFGHARGAFTGAERARPGLLAHAEGGTLLLDEVGELPLARQASLLRALASRRYRPVGSDEEREFNVRIVAATNRDLAAAVAEGRFRQDLLYRLNVIELRVPPLRERDGDVAVLALHFLAQAGSGSALSPEALAALERHTWPGNVRELEHHMQRLAVAGLARIEVAHLPRELRVARGVSPDRPSRLGNTTRQRARSRPASPDREREEVSRALDKHAGNITRAAAELGMTRQGLKKRMVRLGLRETNWVALPGRRS
jgi:DNA-binding NtrC family response regulator